MNWVFCLDGNVLLLGIREARRRQPQLRAITEALGYLDAAIAISSVRAGTKDWVRPTFAPPDATVDLTDLRHPLVPGCVPNSLAIGPPAGIILTGANMTGKSTFLRTVGTNVVLAQTIHTAFAGGYEAPVLAVRTCISPSDDLEGGKSLYQREAETVVSIMDHAAGGGTLLCLFDELFRGTNSADRIGASAAVFSHLARNGAGAPHTGIARCLVIAATHDLELVTRLDDGFRVFHFGDRIAEDRLQFDYRLHPGVATSRNAVALLRLLGAPEAVVIDAMERSGRES